MSKHNEAVETFKQGIHMGGSRRWAAADAIETLLEDETLNTEGARVEAVLKLWDAVKAIPGGEGSDAYPFEDFLYP